MKTAGFVCGLIGGILAFIFSIILIFSGLAKAAWDTTFGGQGQFSNAIIDMAEDLEGMESLEEWDFENMEDLDELEEWGDQYSEDLEGFGMQLGRQMTGIWIAVVFSFLLSILGIVGAAICKRKSVIGGIFMLAAAVGVFICSIFAWGAAYMWIASVLLILGGIFALVPPKPAPAAPATQA